MRSLFVASLLVLQLSLANSRNFGNHFGSVCICGFSENVCGSDGKTYTSQCKADCEGVSVACKGTCPCEEPPSECCPNVSSPICGTDGQTYQNENCATCKGVSVACLGECPCGNVACTCVSVVDPVCGTDGLDYQNECLAGCEGAGVACKGTCPCTGQCICTQEYAPVCSTTGQQYGNKCEAACDKAEIACEKECPCQPSCDGPIAQCLQDPCQGATCPAYPEAKCEANYCGGCNRDFYVDGKIVNCEEQQGCFCTQQYDPVCGTDDKTYGNQCEANCQNVEVECTGECPCTKPNECNGVVFNCIRDPCMGATCAAHPNAECKANHCNGCFAEFYKDGQLVNCDSTCSAQDAECDLNSNSNMYSTAGSANCCPGLTCCNCQPSQRDPSSNTSVKLTGTCQSECKSCGG